MLSLQKILKNENLNIVLIYFVDNILEVMLKIEVLLKKKDEYFFLEIGLNFFLYNLKKIDELWIKIKIIEYVKKMFDIFFEKRKVDLLKNFCNVIEEDVDIRNILLICGEEMY